MNIRTRLYWGIAALGLVAGSAAVAAPGASASSFQCVTSVACGTLHTTVSFGGGTVVAMDAKYQKPTEMVIGYPDLARDKATSFDKVPHAIHTRIWQDTAIVGAFDSSACTQRLIVSPFTTVTCVPAFTGGVATLGSGSQVRVRFTFPSTITLDSATATNLASNLALTGVTQSTVAGVTTVDGFINLGTAVPNNYGGETVTLAGHDGTNTYRDVVTFALHVDGNKVDNPNAALTYYTLVYAPNGDWSNACVTNVGDGDLALRPCTGGRNLDQRFYAEIGGIPQVISNTDVRSFQIENQFPGSNLFMRDTSGANPAVAQPDSSDNRQLTVGASSAVWTWGT